ncbi:MAG: MFS transporter [Xanthomonadales bacterium]|jgi:PAT family beta-lactamase induction signal transducer AmpG|nr:MFS transporter [Xanthomonadales bacterium]
MSRIRWREVWPQLRQPRMLVMLLLGFGCGLPFMLVGNTLGFWLRSTGVELSTIGFLSWVGMAYTLKFLWAPLIDRVPPPLLGHLGRRRGWLLLAQAGVLLGLLGMAALGPAGGLWLFGSLALLAAFASATQDIVVDAWRIESAASDEEQALLSTVYQMGYRAALLTTDALIFLVAAPLGWSSAYALMAALLFLAILATLSAREPQTGTIATTPLWTPRGLHEALLGPFIAFFREHRHWALLILVAISSYRLADFVMGPMANPLYADLGIGPATIGAIRGSVGLVATLAGTAIAGLCAMRYGLVATLLAGALLGPLSNLGFSVLALSGGDTQVFAVAMAVDNFSAGFAGIALIAWMSSLTQSGYTATQYALLSSFYALPGKFLKGLSGYTVETLAVGRSLPEAYAWFFAGTAALAMPVILLCLWLLRRHAPAS